MGPETKAPTCTLSTGFTVPVELTTSVMSPRRTFFDAILAGAGRASRRSGCSRPPAPPAITATTISQNRSRFIGRLSFLAVQGRGGAAEVGRVAEHLPVAEDDGPARVPRDLLIVRDHDDR